MPLYLYALADGLSDISDLRGVRGEPLVVAPAADLTIVGGWVESAPVVDRDALAAQDRVVRALQDRADGVLPMRFGTLQADLDSATRAVRAIGAGLRERLARVRGREQMTLRIVMAAEDGSSSPSASGTSRVEGSASPAPDAAGGDTGTRYLASRGAAGLPPAIRPLLDALRPLQRATRIERGQSGAPIVTVYHLIDRGSSAPYRAIVDSSPPQAALTVHVSGPGPAYAFADLTPR